MSGEGPLGQAASSHRAPGDPAPTPGQALAGRPSSPWSVLPGRMGNQALFCGSSWRFLGVSASRQRTEAVYLSWGSATSSTPCPWSSPVTACQQKRVGNFPGWALMPPQGTSSTRPSPCSHGMEACQPGCEACGRGPCPHLFNASSPALGTKSKLPCE